MCGSIKLLPLKVSHLFVSTEEKNRAVYKFRFCVVVFLDGPQISPAVSSMSTGVGPQGAPLNPRRDGGGSKVRPTWAGGEKSRSKDDDVTGIPIELTVPTNWFQPNLSARSKLRRPPRKEKYFLLMQLSLFMWMWVCACVVWSALSPNCRYYWPVSAQEKVLHFHFHTLQSSPHVHWRVGVSRVSIKRNLSSILLRSP